MMALLNNLFLVIGKDMNYRTVGARLLKMVKNRSLGDREQGLERGVGGGCKLNRIFLVVIKIL